MVGTVDYIAPEVFEKEGYTETVDFWSLGTILFEMLLGYPPFCGKTPSATLNNVLNFEKTFKIPPEPPLSSEAIDLMRKLISRHERRLGRNGVNEIKSHPFFRGVNWKEIRNRPAPIIPKISGEEDTRNFEKFEMTSPWVPVLNQNDAGSRSEGMLFIGYTYKKPHTLDAHKEIEEVFRKLKQRKENDGKRNFSEDRIQPIFGEPSSSAQKIGSNSRLLESETRAPYNFLKKPRANEYTDKGSRPKLTESQGKQFGLISDDGAFRGLKSEVRKAPVSINNTSSKLLERIKNSGREAETTIKQPIKTTKGLLASIQKPLSNLTVSATNPTTTSKKTNPIFELHTKSKVLGATTKPTSGMPLSKGLVPSGGIAKPPSAHPLESLKIKLGKQLGEKVSTKVTPSFVKTGTLATSKKTGV